MNPRRTTILHLGTLAAFVALFYRGLVLERLVIGDYDAFVYFYPLREYAAQMLAHGSFPLWNPYTFMGAPFFANIQTAVLYPPNLLFILLPTPYAFSATVVLHVLLAAGGMYLLGRRVLGVSHLPALLGGIAFAFSGFISAQVSHINQLSVSAWLPVLLILFDESVRRRSISLALVTGLVGTLQFLAGHTQEWYFSTVTLGLFGLWRTAVPSASSEARPLTVENGAPLAKGETASPGSAFLARRLAPLALLATAGLVEIGLSAVQLLPTMELSGESIRGGGMAYGEAVSFSLPPTSLLYTILPTYPSVLFSEYVGYLGIATLLLAAVGVAGWRRRPIVLFMVGLTVLGLFMAIGGYNPLAPLMFKWIPGLDLFRVPARWLLVYTLGAASLAALGAQLLVDAATRTGPRPATGRRANLTSFALTAGLLGVAALVLGLAALVARPTPSGSTVLAWAAILAVSIALVGLAFLRPATGRALLVLLIAIAGVELWAAGGNLSVRFPVPFAAYAPERESTAFVQQNSARDAAPERVLSIASDSYEVKETPDYKKLYSWLDPKSLNQFLVDIKLNETLAPNLPMVYGIQSPDGYDGGVLPLKRYADLKGAIVRVEDAAPDSLLRNHLPYVPSDRILDLLGVEYVLGGKIKDASVENVYYDRGLSIGLSAGQSRTLQRIPNIQATSIGVVSSTLGARELPEGTPVGTIAVTTVGGDRYDIPLRLGTETAETAEADAELGSPAHKRPEQVAVWPVGNKDTDYFIKLRLPARGTIESISVHGALNSGSLRMRAITLIDDQDALISPLVLSDSLDRQLFFDTKVYTYREPLPRAFMAYNSAVRDDELVLAELKNETLDVRRTVLLAPSRTARGLFRDQGPGFSTSDAGVTSYRAEEVVVDATAREAGYLVLMDAYYPGWIAEVDGKEVPVERANYLFRGVWLEKGTHKIVFKYAPRSFEVGGLISGGSLLVFLVVLVAARFSPGTRERVL